MISNTAISSMIIQILLSILVPIIIFIYFRKKHHISFKVTGVGILIFIGFSRILETTLHMFVFGNSTMMELLQNPFIYATYGALAAGIFEEAGRFVAFFFLLKKYLDYKDGLAYGIGHGGIESILIGGFAGVQSLVWAFAVNDGTFAKMVEKTPQLSSLQDLLINTPAYMYLLGGLERVCALVLQIAFTMLVLYAVRQKKYIFVLYAVLFHAGVDFFAALAQKQVISIVSLEVLVVLFSIGAFIVIRKMKAKLITEPIQS